MLRVYIMRLKNLAVIRTDFAGADFWISRRGSIETVGQPTRTFSPYHIGIKVERTDLLLPDYLYYVFTHWHQIGHWQPLARGSLDLVHIQVDDVRNVELQMK